MGFAPVGTIASSAELSPHCNLEETTMANERREDDKQNQNRDQDKDKNLPPGSQPSYPNPGAGGHQPGQNNPQNQPGQGGQRQGGGEQRQGSGEQRQGGQQGQNQSDKRDR
jgi:hypothetical protein